MNQAINREDEALIPEVTDDDIGDIERRWSVSFDQSRREILRSNSSFDVQACPGSGKTTLLVAKLAILAKRWKHSRRGVCVLSHTNVARQEIEDRLAGTEAGERLLSYPHFIGTIHGFVNEYLALPLLRSEGRRVRLIDNEACGAFCNKMLLSEDEFETARAFLYRREKKRKLSEKTIRNLIYVGKDLSLGSATGKLPCGSSAPSFQAMLKIKYAAAESGLWCLEDMFALAERLLEVQPRVVEFIHWRFPACFIDEMQDTSELQIRVLSRLFSDATCALRQRFGDSNQAIFDRGQSRATTDAFPGAKICGITNSQRFSQTIATLVQPLAPDQPQLQLVGEGPPRIHFPNGNSGSMPHTVFLFGPNSIRQVLPSFAQLLLEVFPAETLCSGRFLARAIGHVGRSADEGDELPRGLPDYWPEYEPEGAKLEPRPEKLADFIHLAQRQRANTGDSAIAVSTVVRGIIQLIDRVIPTICLGSVRGLRDIRGLLVLHRPALRKLERLLWQWCIEAVPLREANWHAQLHDLREALTPLLGDKRTAEARDFCKWSVACAADAMTGPSDQHRVPNRYRFPEETPRVEIDIGTIHRAKGQTHTATLVLETFFRGHDVGSLLDWLVGDRWGAGKQAKPTELERLRLVYTAMTRPTHLLCVALREQALMVKQDKEAKIEALRRRGWQVRHLA